MKILFVTPMPPSPAARGAIPVLLHSQLLGLRRNHEVTLLTVAGPREAELEALEALSDSGVEVHAVHRLTPRGLDRVRHRSRLLGQWLSSPWPKRTVWFYEPDIELMVNRLAAKRHFDLIAVEDSAMGVHRYPASIPALLTEHEVRRPREVNWKRLALTGGMAAFGELDWRRWRRYQFDTWSKFALLQVFTHLDAEAAAEIAPGLRDRIRVNPYGVEIPEMLDFTSEEAGTIIFIGNFKHQPNVDAALWLGKTIAPLVRTRLPNLRVTLVGLNAPRAVRGLTDGSIELLEDVPDLRPLLARTAVVVAPIRIGGGMRMKVLHAMAHAKPVVTTSRGAAGLDATGSMPPVMLADDATRFAEATLLLLEDQTRRRSLGQAAREFVAANFSPQAHAERLEAVYSELLQARKAADAA